MSKAGAKEIKAAAAAWRERQDRGNLSAEDQGLLDAWLTQSHAHRIAYLRIGAAWERTERLVALRRPTSEIALPAQRAIPLYFKIAAAVVIVAALGMAGARTLLQPGDRTYVTPVGGRETVSFADGSRIELNTDTVLRAHMTTDRRIIWLDKGEAFFQVKHDAAHPFIVMAGGRRITDLGTQFRVRRDDRRMEVAVVQGRVRFDAPGTEAPLQSAILTPGDVATATAGSMLVTKRSQQVLVNELGWRRGVLVFRYTPLADAAAEFNRYNDTKIIVSDPQAARLKIYGTFRANHIEDFTSLAQIVLGLHIRNNGNEIVISR